MRKSMHRIYFADSANLNFLPSNSVGLMVTSPPYPMIEMWDDLFRHQIPEVDKALD
jgi:site-specific DNA-methyltransferase (cytosine-N4-specific)